MAAVSKDPIGTLVTLAGRHELALDRRPQPLKGGAEEQHAELISTATSRWPWLRHRRAWSVSQSRALIAKCTGYFSTRPKGLRASVKCEFVAPGESDQCPEGVAVSSGRCNTLCELGVCGG